MVGADILHTILDRNRDANKYDFGHVLVVGGSPGMVGAPLLVAEAALRTGAGMVTIASIASVVDKLERRVREVMTLRLPDDDNQATAATEAFIAARKVSVVVLGSGQQAEGVPLARALLQRLRIPVVIDGGALAVFRSHAHLLAEIAGRNPALILTPHTGEYRKVSGDAVDAGDKKRLAARFATKHGVTLVLKGDRTVVAHPDGALYENDTGNPGMATAGTGDALAGVIAGLLAQHAPIAQAAERGVYLHGLAGDIAAETKSQPGMTASDLIECIPAAYRQLELLR